MDEMNKSRMRSNAFAMDEKQFQLQRDLGSITREKMNPLFLENQSKQVDFGFEMIEDVSEQQVAANTLKINRLLENAADLHLTAAQRKDLEIRRNRNLDFELVNDQSKSKDSKEMKAVKNDIREFEKILYQSAKTEEDRQQMIADAMAHCQRTISDCDTYLKKGKSFFFWRQGRYDQVAAAKERFQKDYDTFLKLFDASDTMKTGFRPNDRLIDLMNVEAVNERVAQQAVAEAEEDLRLDEELRQMSEELDEREEGYKQAEGVNDLFTAAEEEQQQKEAEEVERKRQEEEARHAEQVQQQEQQQQEQVQQQVLYGTEVLDELKKQAKTPEMQAIETAITNIQTEMAKEMPAVQVMEDKELEKKAERRARKGKDGVDALCVKMVSLFGALDESIKDCLKKENGAGYGENDALKAILENLRKQTKVDRSQFKDKVVSYRAYIAGNAEETAKKHSWFDAWKYVRSVSYDLDEKNNGLETVTMGAGASMITLIKDTKKKQKVYFRRGENAGGWDSEELVKKFMESIEGEIQCEDAVKENLKKAFGHLIPQKLLDWIKKAFTQQNENELESAIDQLDGLGVSRYRGNDFKKNIDLFVQTASCPGLLKEMYRDATDEVRKEIGKAFTLFARKHFQWSYSVGSARIDPEQSLTDRNVATSRLAGLLGLSSMISDSRTAVIKKDGKEIMGNVMEDSRGKTIDRMKGAWSYSDKAIGQVYTLQVFDMICGQIDRHHGNYHIIEKNRNVNSIKAIDNDMSFGRLTWKDIAAGHENISPLTECHLRAMPIAVINQILSLDEKILQEALGDILDSDSMDYLLDRLGGVQNCIVQYAKKGDAGFKISADGKAVEFTGEDKDDTLRMLKAVKKERGPRTMIWWDNLTEKTLDEKIEARKKELAQIK